MKNRIAAVSFSLAMGLGLVGLGGLVAPSTTQAQGTSVKVVDNDKFGPILTDANGMTLYTWVIDEPPTSKCYDACATSWPPALVTGDAVAPAGLPKKLGTTTRTDGTKQLTYDDWPLYRYARDAASGDITGEGSLSNGGLWPIATTGALTPTVMLVKNPRLSWILTDAKGMTTYTWEGDQPKVSACYDACTAAWPPVLADGGKLIVGAGLSRVLGTAPRTDGTVQVTYKDMPLYTFRRDVAVGDTNGENSRGFGSLWNIALMQVTNQTPAPAASPAAAAAPAPSSGASTAPQPAASPAVTVPAALPRTGDGSSLLSSIPAIAGGIGVAGLALGMAVRRFRR